MNGKSRKDLEKRGEKKAPVRSGFNIFFTLLFVVFMVMVMLTIFEENPLGSTKEISPITFLKVLYSYRITQLEVFESEKVEGEYILNVDGTDDPYEEGGGTPGKSTNRGAFVVELSREALRELTADFARYQGKRVDRGSPAVLFESVENGDIWIQSFHTLVSESPEVRAVDKRGKSPDGQNPMQSGEAATTELFVDFVDQNNTARTERYVFNPVALSSSTVPLRSLIDTIREKYPLAEYRNFQVQNEASLNFNRPNTFWTTILAPLIPWILIIGLLWFFIIRQMRLHGGGGNVLSFGKSRATLVSKERTKITFADVAGIEEAKEEVVEIIEFLKNPSKFSRLGGRIPSGVMLVGSPGTGKTLLAKAIAGEANVPFFSISGSDFVEMFVGVGASRVRDLFRQARENSPCLIFLDEIDAVGRKRGSGLGGGHDEREQTLNAILVEMDGFEKDEGVILVAATNRPDVLDPALLRPGRFDREIVIDLPDLRGREAILKVHCRKVKVSDDVDLSLTARGTPGFSGAELAAIVNEAALIATLKNRNAVELVDFEEARDKVRWGRQKKSRIMTEEDKRITAYHESGHALVANLLPEAEPVHKVTIIPRGAALGATMILPEKDRYHYRKKELKANIKVLYAGRIAEQKFCGDISGGAKNDIEQATETARAMVCQLGMSEKIGPISYGEKSDHIFLGEELMRAKDHSDDVARQIDEEVKRLVDECYQESERLVEAHRDKLELIAQALMQFETLTGKEVEAILAGKSLEEIEFVYGPKAEEKPVQEPQTQSPKEEKPARPDLDPGDLPAAGEPAY